MLDIDLETSASKRPVPKIHITKLGCHPPAKKEMCKMPIGGRTRLRPLQSAQTARKPCDRIRNSNGYAAGLKGVIQGRQCIPFRAQLPDP